MIHKTSKKTGAIILLGLLVLFALFIGIVYYFWDLQTKRCESLAEEYKQNQTQHIKNQMLDEFCNDELYKAQTDLLMESRNP